MTHPSYKIFVSTTGNVFMTEIAQVLADAATQSGRDVQLLRRGLPARQPGVINLVVAPHEYFTLYEGAGESAIATAAAESITVGVEQPGTYWFEYGARYASHGLLALDINHRGVSELRRRGVEAYRLQPGYHSGSDAWGGAASTSRSCDVLFLGSLTERRARILSRTAPILSQWTCDLRLFIGDRPVRSGSAQFAEGQAKHQLLAGSRVLLNIHQGPRDYFEWIRILEAMANGCLVVTEQSGGYAPLVPNQHFLQATLPTLAGQVDAILRDEALRAELALGAYEFVRKRLDFVETVDRLLNLVERRCEQANGSQGSPTSPVLGAAFRRAGRRTPAPVPPPPFVSTEDEAEDPHQQLVERIERKKKVMTAIKNIVLSETSDGRLIEATIAALEHGLPEHALVSDTAGYLRATPEVSVVLTHYNYADFVPDAIASVVASVGVQVELVIVDNHSDPEQLAALRAAIAQYEWFPIRLIANSADQGPSTSRNIGARHARAEFLLLLDADNMLYPDGARLLVNALRQGDAAFAYGLIEKFGRQAGLLSAVPWDVDRLVQGNYIDTMALIRREIWEEFGGFDPRIDAMGGYDDYGFWLQLAAVGYRGELVTSFIGRYRIHGTSWQSLLNIDTTEFMQFYREKHPSLPWPVLERS